MKDLPTLPPNFDKTDASDSSKTQETTSPRILPVDADLEIADSSYSDSHPEQGTPFILRNGLPQEVEPLPVQSD